MLKTSPDVTSPVSRTRRGWPAGPGLSPESRFVWVDRITMIVAALGLLKVARVRGNYLSCLLIPLAIPALLCLTSAPYRRRAFRGVRSLWGSLQTFVDGGKLPWAASVAFVMLPAMSLYLSNDHFEPIGDSAPVVPTAVSLITEGNSDLNEFCRDGLWGGYRERYGSLPFFLQKRGDAVYSRYPSGMVPFALPLVGLSWLAGGHLDDPSAHLRLEKLTASAVAAVSLGVFFILALHLVRPAPALATTAILAVSSGMFSTVGQNLWQHDGVIFWSLLVLLLEFRRPGPWGTVLQGVACGMMAACRLTSAAFLVPFGASVLVRSPLRAAVLVGAAAVTYLPWAWYYASVYGSPLGPSAGQVAGSLWSAEVLVPMAGVLISPGRGLVVYQPWVVLALLAALPSVRRAAARQGGTPGPAGWEWACLASLSLQVLIASAWWCWWGGWCWGSRLVMESVPLCALVCARPIAVLGRSGRGRCLVFSLAALGTLTQVPCVYLDGFRWNAGQGTRPWEAVWSWSRAPFLAPISGPPGQGTSQSKIGSSSVPEARVLPSGEKASSRTLR
jgi:hypothetical protein